MTEVVHRTGTYFKSRLDHNINIRLSPERVGNAFAEQRVDANYENMYLIQYCSSLEF